jgi:hypothetical protein
MRLRTTSATMGSAMSDANRTNDEQIAISHAGTTVTMPASEWIGMHSYATSLRERERRHFAAMAMQGLLANSERWSLLDEPDADLARIALEKTDALLAALNVTKENNDGR